MTNVKPLAGERYAYKRIKSDAAAMRREFSISLEWFAEVCHMPCQYCGRSDKNSISIKAAGRGKWIFKDFKYNGIDRVDSNIGYTQDNCVPCCAVCNRGKRDMGLDQWLSYLHDIIEFRTKEDSNEQDIRDVQFSNKRTISPSRNDFENKEWNEADFSKNRVETRCNTPHWSLTKQGAAVCDESH